MKSECSEHQQKISAYCLGDVTGEEKQSLEAHLDSCSFCRSELESYERTMGRLASIEDEAVPRHFFVYPEVQAPGFWKLLGQMPLGRQTVLAGAATLLLFVGIAGLFRLQVRSDSTGWSVGFGKPGIDAAALKKEILNEAARKNREATMEWTAELRNEVSRSWNSLSKQQQAQFMEALARMDSQLNGRIRNSEGHVKDDTRLLVSDLYRAVSQQRAKDLDAINLRFDSTDAHNALKTRQTNEILGTLLQVADSKLR
jgi:hypothetical protein